MSKIRTHAAFGTAMKARRRKLGLTREELAAKVGVGYHAVTKWEQGYYRPSGPAEILVTSILWPNGGAPVAT